MTLSSEWSFAASAARPCDTPSVEADIQFRIISDAHGAELLALNEACPIESSVTFLVDRAPDFFRWPRAVFEEHAYVGMFHRDVLVGCVLAGKHHAYTGTGDGYGDVLYIGDARVLPRMRGRRLTERAVNVVETHLGADVQFGYFLVKRGNNNAAAMAQSVRVNRAARASLGSFEIVNTWLPSFARRTQNLRVREADPRDVPRVASLLADARKGRLFAPAVDVGALAKRIREATPFPGERVYVAERHGDVVGSVTVHDAFDARRTRLLRLGWQASALRAAYLVARCAMPNAQSPPRPGEALRTFSIVDVGIANDDPAVLHDLLVHVARANMSAGYHVVRTGFAKGDPLRASVSGIAAQRAVADVHVAFRDSEASRRALSLSRGPHVDLRIV
jgi:hypothetical protein